MEQQWFKNALFYSLDVETFFDSNGDAIGDFRGLIQKLDSIAGLGIECIWLLPFYPSPNRDNGYDVTDYYNVDPRLGTLGDFVELMNKAGQLGIRVIIDLVVNHTSIDHPWFQEARKNRESPYRDYYVWSDEPLAYDKEHLMFEGEENTVWTYDEAAKQHYLHRFYRWQPDLNIGNRKVQEEILKIMSYWLRLGVHGFRIDAAAMLVEPYGLPGAAQMDLLNFINEMRDHAQTQKRDVLLLAEVNTGPDEMRTYLQHDQRMHMLFNFYINQHLFLAIGNETNQPLIDALQSLPERGTSEQWLHFLRHHDELNLRLLAEKDQQQLFREFAPQEEMRIYGFGIRRRLAPMMNGNLERLKLAYSLLFSMPGAPMIRYGDEIGMGEDLSLEGRASVRTPMQWSPAANGGFSTAPAQRLVHPVIRGGPFGFERVNLRSAAEDPGSLLNWLVRLMSIRKQCPEIGCGTLFIVAQPNEKVLIHGFEWQDEKLLLIHNLSNEKTQLAERDFGGQKWHVVLGEIAAGDEGPLVLPPYGYCWLRSE